MRQSLQLAVDIVPLVATETVNLEYSSAISLACTCRAFEAAVMEVLWGSHQTNLTELLRCFPEEVWDVQESNGGRLCFVWTRLSRWCCPMRADSWPFVASQNFRRHPLPSEWERVDRYAEWMRNLNIYEDSTGPNLSPQAWRELRTIRPAHLLPNLQSLEWYSDTDAFEYIDLFWSPQLTSLKVRIISNIPNVDHILASLPVKTLEELRILDLSGNRAVQGVISSLVLRTTTTLRSIEVSSDLSDTAIRHVTQLPNLNDASVRFVDLHLSAASPDGTFPSLRTLETRVDNEGRWKYLLGDTMELESLVLHSLTALHWQEAVNVFGFLINKGLHRTIHRFSFAASEPCDLIPFMLTPLHNFGHLTRLSVTSPCDPGQCKSQLTDGSLTQLAEALPQLVELFLGDVPCRSPARGITLAGLHPLSTHCVNLETLQIHFDALDTPMDVPEDVLSKLPDQLPPNSNYCHLFRLVVGGLPVSASAKSPAIVAYLLHQMFPRLSKILRTVEDSPWKEVQEYIDVFQKYRLKQ